MRIDALVAEIGSTTTVVNAFDKLDSKNPVFLGSGYAPTTVLQGDVNVGLKTAIENLAENIGADDIEPKEFFASSSAAGGLKMSVHGLVYDMTVKAAKEAALGAGANIKMITAGGLDDYQLEEIKALKLNIIMIAGGVDYGERKTALENSEKIAKLKLNIPVIYAGNIQNHNQVKKFFSDNDQSEYLFISDNVYPKIDVLQVEKTRKIIQSVFEKHIIHAPGMEHVTEIVNQNIIPTPGAVMEAALLLKREYGDLLVVDVGGATSDIHSVTDGSKEIEKIMLAPEPFAKRTVEGDLGVYVNKDNIINSLGEQKIIKDMKIDKKEYSDIIANYKPIPENGQIPLVERLTLEAFKIALERHAGRYVSHYNATGKVTYAEGKDLTNVKYVIATGGALTRLPNRENIIRRVIQSKNNMILKPRGDCEILIDNYYIMASLGVLAKKHPAAALELLKQSLKIG